MPLTHIRLATAGQTVGPERTDAEERDEPCYDPFYDEDAAWQRTRARRLARARALRCAVQHAAAIRRLRRRPQAARRHRSARRHQGGVQGRARSPDPDPEPSGARWCPPAGVPLLERAADRPAPDRRDLLQWRDPLAPAGVRRAWALPARLEKHEDHLDLDLGVHDHLDHVAEVGEPVAVAVHDHLDVDQRPRGAT